MSEQKTNIVRKVTTATIMGDVQVMIRDGSLEKLSGVDVKVNGAKVPLYHIFAHAGSAAVKDTDLGASWKFTGMFEGLNLLTGELFQAAVCYLPGIAADIVAGQLTNNPDAQAVQFAAEIGMEIDHKAATGYVYTFRPLVMKASNLLADLKAQVAALPAPSKVEAEPEHEEHKGKGKKA